MLLMHTYSQSTGEWRHDGELIGAGYSGALPFGINNPEMQGVLDEGPIPQGRFTIGPPSELAGGPHGPYVLRLTPDSLTAARIANLGRDPYSFLCHGGKTGELDPYSGTASKGCVILMRPFRESIARFVVQGDNQLMVIA